MSNRISSFLLSSFVFLTLTSHADEIKIQTVEVSPQKVVAVEDHRLNSEEATLIFLPGVNRGLVGKDDFVVQAKKANLNFILMHSSLHPASLFEASKLKNMKNQMTSSSLSDLAEEVDSLVKKMKITNPVIVSLSYSGAISSALAQRGYRAVIEFAPIGRYDDSLNAFQKYWAQISDWNREGNYRTFWSTQVGTVISQFPEYSSIKSQVVEGYVKLSLIIHGFDYREQNFKLKQNQQRYLIVGENELSERLKIQLEAGQKLMDENNLKDNLFMVPKSGHNVLFDSPDFSIKLIQYVLTK